MMTSTSTLGTLGLVVSLLAGTLFQRNDYKTDNSNIPTTDKHYKQL